MSYDVVTANRRSRSVTVLLSGVNAPQPVVCLVPRVVKRTLKAAKRIVRQAKCSVGPVRRRYSGRVRRGRVIAEKPVAGLRLPSLRGSRCSSAAGRDGSLFGQLGFHRRTRDRKVRRGAHLARRRALRAARRGDARKDDLAADDGRQDRRPVPRDARAPARRAADPRARHVHGLLVDLDGLGPAARRVDHHLRRRPGGDRRSPAATWTRAATATGSRSASARPSRRSRPWRARSTSSSSTPTSRTTRPTTRPWLPLLAENGLVIADNVLWSGRVVDENEDDESTRAIKDFNEHVRDDERVVSVMLRCPRRDDARPEAGTTLQAGAGAGSEPLYDTAHATVPSSSTAAGPVSCVAPSLTEPPSAKTLFVCPEIRDW